MVSPFYRLSHSFRAQQQVDNFVDEETEEECFYTPTGVQPSSMQGVIAGDLSPLIADLQAEMAAIVALDVCIHYICHIRARNN